jgi:hypothetical protein
MSESEEDGDYGDESAGSEQLQEKPVVIEQKIEESEDSELEREKAMRRPAKQEKSVKVKDAVSMSFVKKIMKEQQKAI